MRLIKSAFLILCFFYAVLPVGAQNSKINRLAEKLRSTATDSARTNLMNDLSYQLQGIDPERAREYAQQALELSEKINYRSGKAYSLTNLANINSNRGDYDKALGYYNKALQIRKEDDDKQGIGKSLLGIGNIYLMWGNYNKALECYLKSLKISEELRNKHDMAFCQNNIGAVYYYQKNYDKSLECWQQAVNYYQALGQKEDMISCLANMGNVYGEQNQPGKALELFNQSLKLSVELGDKQSIAAGHLNIGSIYLNLRKFGSALDEFAMASEIYHELGDKENKALTLIYTGEVYRKESKFNKAVAYLDTALRISREIRSRERVKLCYKELAQTYAAARDFENAYKNYQLFSNENDSLLNEETSKQIAEMQTKYDTEKKEKENKILKQTVDIHELNANRQRIIIYSVCALAVLLVSLAVFIYRSYRQKKTANIALSEKNKIIEEQHKDITDSIRYAQRIQQAILPPEKMWFDLLPDSFVLYKPKDILSGDFYWIEECGDFILVAAADCTGHGVPGALMSIVNFNLLNKAVLEQNIAEPSKIIDLVNQWLTLSLHQTYNQSAVRDGMDIALCAIHKKSKKMMFSGAFNGAYIFKNDGNFIELTGDKMPVGAFMEDKVQSFSNTTLALDEGDRLFIFSDGYADQFGGPKGKKLKYTNMKQYMAESNHLAMAAQKNYLEQKFNEWKGRYEQVDDVLVIGIRL